MPIDYEAEGGPKIAIRVQELFGLDRHPAIAGGRVPLVIELLSPAHRPVQTTRDLPGFWRGSYAAVRTEMRGRYPKHPWPDDPIAASADAARQAARNHRSSNFNERVWQSPLTNDDPNPARFMRPALAAFFACAVIEMRPI